MSTVILVHGSWHGAWCWDKLVPLLEQRGHRVDAVDLPAHGADRTPISSVTAQSYVQRVCAIVDAAPDPVILVGHSSGGRTIAEVGEARPERVQGLIFLAGFLLRDGQSVLDVGQTDNAALILPNLQISADKSHATLRAAAIKDIFYHDCGDDVAAWASRQFVPEPMVPIVTPVRLSAERFGRLPRAYIVCEQDRSITLECQRRMIAATPCDPVISLDSSHSPFLSMPQKLTDALVAAQDAFAANSASGSGRT